jgi:CubicO group peptidase (beta-lactamase class C family)
MKTPDKRSVPALATLFLACLALSAATHLENFPPPDSAGGWSVPKDSIQARIAGGVDPERLEQAFRFVQQTTPHGGLLVVRHGMLIFEKYFGKGNREAHPDMASIGKAYTSIACGIMLHEKQVEFPDGLDQKVFTEKYLPEALPLHDPAMAEIRLGNLLTMTAGLHGDGTNPGFVHGETVPLDPVTQAANSIDPDVNALNTPLWTKPGQGYSYSSPSPHLASMILRHITGMELQQYIDEHLAKPMGWGPWGYALYRSAGTIPHTPGGGSISVRATDAVRFGYLLLHLGRWGSRSGTRQLVPASYIELCSKPSPYNPHSPFSLMFEVNADGHVIGAPRDAYFKSGAGGSALYVVPSLDMVIYKMSGSDAQFAPELTGLPVSYAIDHSRDNWKPGPHTQFHDGPIGGDDGVRRLLEMVVAAVMR